MAAAIEEDVKELTGGEENEGELFQYENDYDDGDDDEDEEDDENEEEEEDGGDDDDDDNKQIRKDGNNNDGASSTAAAALQERPRVPFDVRGAKECNEAQLTDFKVFLADLERGCKTFGNMDDAARSKELNKLEQEVKKLKKVLLPKDLLISARQIVSRIEHLRSKMGKRIRARALRTHLKDLLTLCDSHEATIAHDEIQKEIKKGDSSSAGFIDIARNALQALGPNPNSKNAKTGKLVSALKLAVQHSETDGQTQNLLLDCLLVANAFQRDFQSIFYAWIKKIPIRLPSPEKLGFIQSQLLVILENILPTAETNAKNRDLFQELQRYCERIVPRSQLLLCGSMASGFGHKNSDLDLGWKFPTELTENKILHALQSLSYRLRNTYPTFWAFPVLRTRVPIVKVYHYGLDMQADVSVENPLNTHKANLLSRYVTIDKRLRNLTLLVKHWAKSRGVNDASLGTFNSYAYTLMCIHLLQAAVDPPILPCLHSERIVLHGSSEVVLLPEVPVGVIDDVVIRYHTDVTKLVGFGAANTMTEAQLLARFFQYYSDEFDFSKMCVSVRLGAAISKAGKLTQGRQRSIAFIEDPFDPTDNAGRSIELDHLIHILLEMRRASHVMSSAADIFVPVSKQPGQDVRSQFRPPTGGGNNNGGNNNGGNNNKNNNNNNNNGGGSAAARHQKNNNNNDGNRNRNNNTPRNNNSNNPPPNNNNNNHTAQRPASARDNSTNHNPNKLRLDAPLESQLPLSWSLSPLTSAASASQNNGTRAAMQQQPTVQLEQQVQQQQKQQQRQQQQKQQHKQQSFQQQQQQQQHQQQPQSDHAASGGARGTQANRGRFKRGATPN